jgi:ribosomal-protein-alanine N-acetyltransferase
MGKRVGRLLLEQCLEVARQRRLARIFLEVRHSNHRAIRFYRRNRFRIISRRKNYYRDPSEDAWVMERPAAGDPLPNGGSGVRQGINALPR